jgi:hypothetical protein
MKASISLPATLTHIIPPSPPPFHPLRVGEAGDKL